MNSPVETLTNRRLDWSWSVTKLKAIFQILFVQVFLLLVKETKFKIFIGFFSHWEVSILYSNGGSTARACWGSAKNYWVSLSEVFYKIKSIRLNFWSIFKVGLSNSNFACNLITWNRNILETCQIVFFRKAEDKVTVGGVANCAKPLYLVSAGRYPTD